MNLVIDGVSVRYGRRLAVKPTALSLASGNVVALVGSNGAGKSSLLKAIAGLVPQTGTIAWGDRDLSRYDRHARARTIAYLPQSPEAHWPMRVRDLVGLGRLPHRALGQARTTEDADAVAWAMQQTDAEFLAERSVDELSGGELCRVQLARALAVRAPILLVDEPVASLDPYHQLKIMHVLAEHAAREGLVIAVMHDLTLAARFASRMILMHEGAVVEDGPARHVLREETLRRYYRVHSFVVENEGQPLIVPWRTLD
jgi:iron complex transport system ATP-binding protein